MDDHLTAALGAHYLMQRLSGERPEPPMATMQAAFRAQADALSGRPEEFDAQTCLF